jgi:hypothetical protein
LLNPEKFFANSSTEAVRFSLPSNGPSNL